MPNIFKNFLNSMKLTEDDEYEDYNAEEDEKELKRSRRNDRRSDDDDSYDEAPKDKQANSAAQDLRKERMARMERTAGKVVPMRSTPKGLEVCIVKPTSFEDSQIICDMLLTGRATVINLEGFDDKLAQRTMDFVSGSVYAINGKLHRISSSIFIVSPDTVDISGDYLDMIHENVFEPPIFQTKF